MSAVDITDLADANAAPLTGKLGLNLHAGLLKPKLFLGDYLEAQAEPPPAVHRSHYGFAWGMLGNDVVGDCEIAMLLHDINAYRLSAGLAPFPFTTEAAIALYSAIAGYNPADPSTDQGTDPGQAHTYWQTIGIPLPGGGVDKIAATVAIDPADDLHVAVGVYEFVAVDWALAMPLSAQTQRVWDVVGDGTTGDSAPGSWGGHAVDEVSYDPNHEAIGTWGGIKLMTKPFRRRYAQGASVNVNQNMLSLSGASVTGLKIDKLLSDVRAL